jgi:hypothetical protein
MDLTEDAIENYYNDAPIRQFSSCFGIFTLQDKNNIHTLLVNIKFICTCEKVPKARSDLFPVYKARTNKFYICRKYCLFIFYVSENNRRNVHNIKT